MYRWLGVDFLCIKTAKRLDLTLRLVCVYINVQLQITHHFESNKTRASGIYSSQISLLPYILASLVYTIGYPIRPLEAFLTLMKIAPDITAMC